MEAVFLRARPTQLLDRTSEAVALKAREILQPCGPKFGSTSGFTRWDDRHAAGNRLMVWRVAEGDAATADFSVEQIVRWRIQMISGEP